MIVNWLSESKERCEGEKQLLVPKASVLSLDLVSSSPRGHLRAFPAFQAQIHFKTLLTLEHVIIV
jgi:hypothetical protein